MAHSDYQSIQFIGRMGGEPEMRYTPSGQPVTTVSVAVNTAYKGSDGNEVKYATWYRVSFWSGLAEVVQQYGYKGQRVFIEGTLSPDKATGTPRIWTKNDGTPAATFEVRCRTLQMLSFQNEDGKPAEGPAQRISDPEPSEDDIPF